MVLFPLLSLNSLRVACESLASGSENWARAVPERTLILGKKQNKDIIGAYLISKDQFRAVLLTPEEFTKKSKSRKFLVVDVREAEQREQAPIELQGIQQIPLGDFILKLEKQGELPRGNMLILDNVGKQVRWLQYFLEEYGIKNYFFLKGGVKQWKEDGLNPQGKR